MAALLPLFSLQAQSLETSLSYTAQNASPSSLLHLQLRSQLIDFAKSKNRSWGPELQFGRWFLFSESVSSLRPEWNLTGGLRFTEFFGAQSFRVGVGAGAVRMKENWRAAFDYRMGIGQRLGESPWHIHLDLMGRHIWNRNLNQSVNQWGAGLSLAYDFL